MRRKRDTVLTARLSARERAQLLAAAEASGKTLSRFVIDSAMEKSGQVLGAAWEEDSPSAKALNLSRRGRKGVEGKGWALGRSIEARLKARHAPQDVAMWMELFREARAKNDHIDCWGYLSRSLPEEIRGMPERSQVKFLKAFLKGLSGKDL